MTDNNMLENSIKDKIILATATMLENSKVRFTIDDIASELKISKKTVYKYFESKEDLAQAVFNNIITKSLRSQQEILASGRERTDKVVLCFLEYMEIFRLQSEKILYLYRLNAKLIAEVKQNIQSCWVKVLEVYHEYTAKDNVKKIDDSILKIIIEGIFKNIYFNKNRSKIGYDCIKSII